MTMTKKYRKASACFWWLSTLSLTVPIVVYIIKALASGTDLQKVTLFSTVMISIVLAIINAMMKIHMRSIIWILVLGIYTCLGNIQNMLIIIAAATILDECFFTPMHKKYKELYHINREIDKREK